MSITYTYEIIRVDEDARCMEVVYAAEGHQTMHISTRLPFVGESLEAVIRMYAPVVAWLEALRSPSVPAVGTTGSVDTSKQQVFEETDEEKQARLNVEMWEQVNFERRVASALVKLGVLSENPTLIPVAEL